MNELILIVDDNVGIRGMLKEVLTNEGYRVEVASNGEEATEKFNKHVPSVVLLDSRMPGMSGVMVAERLKTLSPELPIIMISGYSKQEDVKIAQQKGHINYCLAKPFDLDKINKHIHLVLINNSEVCCTK